MNSARLVGLTLEQRDALGLRWHEGGDHSYLPDNATRFVTNYRRRPRGSALQIAKKGVTR